MSRIPIPAGLAPLFAALLPLTAMAQVQHTVRAAVDPIRVDGRLDERTWLLSDSLSLVINNAPTGGSPKSETTVRAAWDATHLYIAITAESRNVEGRITQHDGPLYTQDVVEMFLDPDGDGKDYLELEWNCLNTSLDYRYAGPRTGLDAAWTANMVHAVRVQGTANDPADVDTGMTVEIALPWSDLDPWSQAAVPPKPGNRLRVNFYRIDFRGTEVEELTAWSPTGVADFHRPDKFGQLVFAEAATGLRPRRAAGAGAAPEGPRFTPDGRRARERSAAPGRPAGDQAWMICRGPRDCAK